MSRAGSAERAHERRVDECENRAVGADPQREREDGDDREGGRLHQRSQAVTQIEEQGSHEGFSRRCDGAADARRARAFGRRVRSREG
jgi:hypothetical protein